MSIFWSKGSLIILFASGNGSNVENIDQYFQQYPEISLLGVFTNNPNAGVINKAERLGLPIEVFDKEGNFEYSINPHNSNEPNVKVLELDPEKRKFTTNEYRLYPEYMNLKKGQYEIDCKIGKNTSDLYIDCDGALLPCCFIGAGIYTSPLDRQLQTQFSNRKQFIPTAEYTYKQIFQNEYYTDTIHKGILGDLPEQPKYTVKCMETCGKCQ